MTKEEAIAYGKRVISLGLNDETQAFCELAIKVLDQEQSEKKNYKNEARRWKRRYLDLKQQARWIPVSERLPSDCGCDWVLAQIQEPDSGYLWIPCVARYCKETDDWFSDACGVEWLRNHNEEFKVVAWMPLPEPYKAESEG